MQALSVRAPWWWAILHLGKDIENRDWPTRFRGRVLLHASSWFRLAEIHEDLADIRRIRERANVAPLSPALTITPRMLRNAGGALVGSVEIVNCVPTSTSPWFFGKYGFQLRNPVAFTRPIPYRGQLGFFDVPDRLEGLSDALRDSPLLTDATLSDQPRQAFPG